MDDNPIGFLIFVVLAIVMTVAGKVSEYYKRKKREEDLPPTRVEDLPEATRRTIYGDQGPGGEEGRRVEVPASTREVPQAAPVRPVCEMCQRPLSADFRVGARIGVPGGSGHYCSESCYREAGAAMFVAGMDAAGRGAEVPDWVREQASMNPRQLEVQEISRGLYRQVLEEGGRLDTVLGRPGMAQLSSLTRGGDMGSSVPAPLQEVPARRTMVQTPSGYQQAREPRRRVARRTPPTVPATAAEAKPVPRRRRAVSLFQDLDQVRHGIVMQEILGPPKSMREL